MTATRATCDPRRPAAPGLRRLPARRRRADGLRRPARARGRATSSAPCATASSASPGLEEMLATARVLDAIERSARSPAPGSWRATGARPMSVAWPTRRSVYGAFEMTVGTDFPVPDPERILEAIGARRLRRDRSRPARLSRRGRRAARAPGDERPRGRRRLRPHAILRGRALRGGRARACPTRSICSTPPARPARAPCSATPAAPSGSPTPAAGARTPALRLDGAALAHARRGRRARGRRRARARLRAGLPPPHVDLRRGRARRSSASSRTPTCSCCSTRGHLAVAGGDPVQALNDWGDRIGAVHIKDVRLDVLASVKAERADTLTAWRRGLFCALGAGRRRPRRFLRRARRPRLRRLGGRRAGPRARRRHRLRAAPPHEQVRNRDWLREHAGW